MCTTTLRWVLLLSRQHERFFGGGLLPCRCFFFCMLLSCQVGGLPLTQPGPKAAVHAPMHGVVHGLHDERDGQETSHRAAPAPSSRGKAPTLVQQHQGQLARTVDEQRRERKASEKLPANQRWVRWSVRECGQGALCSVSGYCPYLLFVTGVRLRGRESGEVEFNDVRLESTEVRFEPLSNREIDDYVATAEPLDKAGAYAIQGAASRWISGIRGDYCNVVGLPVALVYRMLREHGIGGPAGASRVAEIGVTSFPPGDRSRRPYRCLSRT